MNIQKALLGSLVAVIVYNLLFFGSGFGIGTGLFFLLINAYLFFIRSKEAPLVPGVVASTISVLFGLFQGYQANPEVQFVNFLLSAFTTVLAVYFYRIGWREQLEIGKLLVIPFFVGIRSLIAAVKLLFMRNEDSDSQKIPIGPILRGLVITVPLCFILLVLLVRADAVFQNLAEKVLSQSMERIIISVFLFGLLTSLGLSSFQKFTERVKGIVGKEKIFELAIPVGSIVVLFGMFILIQFQYLFSWSGERELGKLGIASLTYSEYVRRGFFELLIAATIAGGVITYILHYLYRLSSPSKMVLQLLTGFLTFETGILLYSAFTRLVLYAVTHGLTRARMWGFLFLLWLAGILIILLIRTIQKVSQEKVAYGVIGITLTVLLFMNFFTMDNGIATKYQPTVNNEIDYSYIALLSADAYPSWRAMLAHTGGDVARLEQLKELTSDDNRKLYLDELTLSRLNFNLDTLLIKYASDDQLKTWFGKPVEKLKEDVTVGSYRRLISNRRKWQEFNMSEYQAYRSIIGDLAHYRNIRQLLLRIEGLRSKLQQISEPQLDRPVNPPVLK